MLTFALAESLCASLLSPRAGAARRPHPSAQEKPAPVRERFQNAEVIYDWVSNKRGDKLRTFITRPKNSAGKVPAIFFVGWLSCDSMEYAKGETDGFGALMLRLIDQSGYATIRMNKPGVGESGGHCEKTDFQSELERLASCLRFPVEIQLHRSGPCFCAGTQQRRWILALGCAPTSGPRIYSHQQLG